MKTEEVVEVVRAYQRQSALAEIESLFEWAENDAPYVAKFHVEHANSVLIGAQHLGILTSSEADKLSLRSTQLTSEIEKKCEEIDEKFAKSSQKDVENTHGTPPKSSAMMDFLNKEGGEKKADTKVERPLFDLGVKPDFQFNNWARLWDEAEDLGKHFPPPMFDAHKLDKNALWVYVASKYGLNLNALGNGAPVHKKADPPEVEQCPTCTRQMPKGEKECGHCAAKRRYDDMKTVVVDWDALKKVSERKLSTSVNKSKRARSGRSEKRAAPAR